MPLTNKRMLMRHATGTETTFMHNILSQFQRCSKILHSKRIQEGEGVNCFAPTFK